MTAVTVSIILDADNHPRQYNWLTKAPDSVCQDVNIGGRGNGSHTQCQVSVSVDEAFSES